jgi:hypothetical protein
MFPMNKPKNPIILVLICLLITFVSCTGSDKKEAEMLVVPACDALAGETDLITVTITNTGDSDVSSTAALLSSGRKIDARKITVPAEADGDVQFDIKDLPPGIYDISVGDCHGKLTIISLEDLLFKSKQATCGIKSYHMSIEIDIQMAQ